MKAARGYEYCDSCTNTSQCHQTAARGFECRDNNVLVPRVFECTFGQRMDLAWARGQGLGPPQPGIGDRGFVR